MQLLHCKDISKIWIKQNKRILARFDSKLLSQLQDSLQDSLHYERVFGGSYDGDLAFRPRCKFYPLENWPSSHCTLVKPLQTDGDHRLESRKREKSSKKKMQNR